jgi:hypothetical protein
VQSLTQTHPAAGGITACDGYKPFRYRAESSAGTTAGHRWKGRPTHGDRYVPSPRTGWCKPTTPALRRVTAARLGSCPGSKPPEAMGPPGLRVWRASGVRTSTLCGDVRREIVTTKRNLANPHCLRRTTFPCQYFPLATFRGIRVRGAHLQELSKLRAACFS